MELLPGIIHEIASPIGYLRSNTEILEEQFQEFPDMDEDFIREDCPVLFKDMHTGIDRIQGISAALKVLYDSFYSPEADVAAVLDACLKTAHNRLKYHWTYTAAIPRIPFVLPCSAGEITSLILSLLILIDKTWPEGGDLAFSCDFDAKIVVFQLKNNNLCTIKPKIDDLTGELKTEGFTLYPELEENKERIIVSLAPRNAVGQGGDA